jgi:hypothetical protein
MCTKEAHISFHRYQWGRESLHHRPHAYEHRLFTSDCNLAGVAGAPKKLKQNWSLQISRQPKKLIPTLYTIHARTESILYLLIPACLLDRAEILSLLAAVADEDLPHLLYPDADGHHPVVAHRTPKVTALSPFIQNLCSAGGGDELFFSQGERYGCDRALR